MAQRAWVTGGSGYWGRKVILSLLRRDWDVVALSRTRPEDLMLWAEAQGKSLAWQPLDFESPDWPASIQPLPLPQAFFLCSGVFSEDMDTMLRINVTQPIRLMEMLIDAMPAQGAGRIGVFLGQNGRLGLPGLGAFSATQGALWTWAEARAKDLREQNSPVTLTLVFPNRAASALQKQLAGRLNRKVRLKPPGTADRLVDGVLKGSRRAGRRPLAAGILTLLS